MSYILWFKFLQSNANNHAGEIFKIVNKHYVDKLFYYNIIKIIFS